MPVEVIMPKVDMDMTTGRILVWHVGEGERVGRGTPLFDIETDKAAMEVEAEAEGFLHHRAPEGAEVPIGQPVAWIYAEGEAVGPPPGAASATGAIPPAAGRGGGGDGSGATAGAAPGAIGAPRAGPTETGAEGRPAGLRATPAARRLAREAGLDLATLQGSGPRGRIQGADVRARLETAMSPVPSPAAGFTPEAGGLSVTRRGAGRGRPIVLLHGFASDSLSWAPVEAHLGDRPILRIDLPAHGKSPLLAVRSFAELAALMRDTIDRLDLAEFDLVGHSLGGALALALADTRPRRIAALTLIAPAGLGPQIAGDVLRGICAATRPESLAPWLRMLVADERLISDGYVRQAMAGRARAELRAAQAALAGILFPDGVQAFDLRAALDRVGMPTRIIWGRRDAVIPWRHALTAPGRVALHLFPELGHVPHLERPDAIAPLLRGGMS